MAVKSVEEYIKKHPQWEEEIISLRDLLLSAGLEETIKWGAPTYTLNDKNVIGIAAFKNHAALWFFQGALLQENTALLKDAQENKTAAMRQIRFEKGAEMNLEMLEKYILEAVQNQREGKTVWRTPSGKTQVPSELKEALEKDENLETAFKGLSPGKQREYSRYISEAKRASTKADRLKKILPMIREGRGLNDRYKK